MNLLPHMNHDIPQMYSGYTPHVLNTTRCTEHTLYNTGCSYQHDSNVVLRLINSGEEVCAGADDVPAPDH